MRRVSSCFVLVALVAASLPAAAQLRVDRGVDVDTVTVGEPFHSVVRVRASTGAAIQYLDLPAGDSIQALGPVQVAIVDGEPVGVYLLVAWAAGARLEAEAPVRIVTPDGAATLHEVALRLPQVRSVLPAVDVEPRGAKGFIPLGSAPLPWWWWLLALLALLAVGGGVWAWLRRSPEPIGALPVDAREWALEELGAAGAGALLEAGAYEELYRRVASVVRIYLWRVRPELSPDLTTTELLERIQLEGGVGAGLHALADLLPLADRVKFARYRPGATEAAALIEAAREWVASYPPASAEDVLEGRAA